MSVTKTIFLIEDDWSIRTDLAELLEMEGYEVTAAENGAEALKLLNSNSKKPSLIILDLMMPVMDGWQFREEQMKSTELSQIPVVVMTADGNASEKAARMNANGFVQKPIQNVDHFLKTIVQYGN